MSYLKDIAERSQALTFTNEEIKRYSRHLIMPEVTLEGQRKLKASRVLCIGTGGLGSPLLAYLAAAGIGKIGVVDYDRVDHSNLQRQIIHRTSSVGKFKTQSAKEAMLDINPHIAVETYDIALNSSNAMELFAGYDVIVDGTDNFPTRYLVNDTCVLLGKPNVYGSIFRFDGQATVFWAEKGPCYRCLYPEPPDPGMVPSCAEGGVLGILPGIIGVIQATETVKLILGVGETLVGRLLVFDALKMRFKEMKLRKDPACPICGENRTIHELIDYNQFCGMPSVEAPLQKQMIIPEIAPADLKKRIDAGDKLILLDVREPHEYDICHIPGSKLFPVNKLPSRLHELDTADEIIIYCKGELRTEQAFKTLLGAGFKKLHGLEGGIEGWAEDVDPDMPTY